MSTIKSVKIDCLVKDTVRPSHPRCVLKHLQLINKKYKIREFLGGKEGNYNHLAENITLSEPSDCILKQFTHNLEKLSVN
jgi:hypothetical protein